LSIGTGVIAFQNVDHISNRCVRLTVIRFYTYICEIESNPFISSPFSLIVFLTKFSRDVTREWNNFSHFSRKYLRSGYKIFLIKITEFLTFLQNYFLFNLVWLIVFEIFTKNVSFIFELNFSLKFYVNISDLSTSIKRYYNIIKSNQRFLNFLQNHFLLIPRTMNSYRDINKFSRIVIHFNK